MKLKAQSKIHKHHDFQFPTQNQGPGRFTDDVINFTRLSAPPHQQQPPPLYLILKNENPTALNEIHKMKPSS